MYNNYPPGITDADINGESYFCPNCGQENPDLDNFWLTEHQKGECCPGVRRLYSDGMGHGYVLWEEDRPLCYVCDAACEDVYLYGIEPLGCENCLEVTTIGEILERERW